jgi:hypothetical protein
MHLQPLVLDIGSGQGYLSRVLAMQKGLDVIGVEADSCNVNAAARSDTVVAAELHSKGWAGITYVSNMRFLFTHITPVQELTGPGLSEKHLHLQAAVFSLGY